MFKNRSMEGVSLNAESDPAGDYVSGNIVSAVTLPRVLAAALLVLAVKIFFGILNEYRWYLPPDFDTSAFLSGRRYTFVGAYRIGFYLHLVAAPLALLMATAMMLRLRSKFLARHHRFLGRVLMVVILLFLFPSGLILAEQAYAGNIARAAFLSLSFATVGAFLITVYHARQRHFDLHACWALRCFILLASPLMFRLCSGAMITLQLDSEWFYRLNAWTSWVIPIMTYELFRCGSDIRQQAKRALPLSALCVCLWTLFFASCDSLPLPSIVTGDAEFSSPEDYNQYDVEMAAAAEGQAE